MHALRIARLFPAILIGLVHAVPVSADVRLPAIVGDNMVLQQQADVRIWGWADPGEDVRIEPSWRDEPAETNADDNGAWSVTMRTPAAGGPHTLKISGRNTITLQNVMVGEVWVCGGQSNMEWTFALGVENGEQERLRADYPQIRFFDVPHRISLNRAADCDARWTTCNPDTVNTFSAVGYFFGRKLHRELKVPVGLIGSNWGGTVAEAWMNEEALRPIGDYDDTLDRLDRMRRSPEQMEEIIRGELDEWWRALRQLDPGSGADGYHRADFDDSAWSQMKLPGRWEQRGLDGFDGVVWYRREVSVPQEWAGRNLVLELGPIDDLDTVWLNGVRVGATQRGSQWLTPRKYTVPSSAVRVGWNVFAVRVVDTGGAGGMFGRPEQLRLGPAADASDEFVALAGDWRYCPGAELKDLPDWPAWTSLNQNMPTVLFDGMIAPLTPYTIRGVIWYQGESNRSHPVRYHRLFSGLILDWRKQWNVGDFPFYFVQIAPFAYSGDIGEAAALRDSQRRALSVPNTGMAVTMDIGDPKNIHPRNKQEVGRRLALWALAKTYDRSGLTFSGPLYRDMKVEVQRIRLYFDHAAGGLHARGPLKHFIIAGKDRRFVPAQADIDGETVVVWSDGVTVPVAVRYGWGAADETNLQNRAGLPAASFRTDDWPLKSRD